MSSNRHQARFKVLDRKSNARTLPEGEHTSRVSYYFGQNAFDIYSSRKLTEDEKLKLLEIGQSNNAVPRDLAKKVADAVLEWAKKMEVTHFCHWFQPLTGDTAEKHDAFIDMVGQQAIEKFSASQLMQGEPDASSFPNGGSRSTFEARGYTSWDMTSPIFIRETANGKTLCIPTAFVSYHGDALDIKTPLLRSLDYMNREVKEFCKLSNTPADRISVSCGCEQEYFLVDRALFIERPDLIMTGRTVLGSGTTRNQQLEDHYFGTIGDRVLNYMQEVEYELYKLGIPAKTRHNEVAPGQFEIAPIFREANVAADQNQLVMTTLRQVALRHDFVCLLHEKPFGGINGSGKHLNWSIATNTGVNLLEPGDNPHANARFLAVCGIVIEALNRHQGPIRAAIAGHGNDHRLGANEAPPSILSVFLGDTLFGIFESFNKGEAYTPKTFGEVDINAKQLATLKRDNTDRNRTSPFAFTGNKFEFRAVGSSASIGFPLSILNAAVAEVFAETNKIMETEIKGGATVDAALMTVAKKWYANSSQIVFNGDGYSDEWKEEAKRRGLLNLETTADAIEIFKSDKETAFLTESGVYRSSELETRYNVLIERYIKHREIEFNTLRQITFQEVIPAAVHYKQELANTIKGAKDVGGDATVEADILNNLSYNLKDLYAKTNMLCSQLEEYQGLSESQLAGKIAHELMPLSESIADISNTLESIIPEQLWTLPTYQDLLFIR